MFREIEQKAIKEKLEQLQKIKDGSLSPKKLANLITARRIAWFQKNKDACLLKFTNLPDEEKAYRIIFLEHMKINPGHSEMIRISGNEIKVNSYNFCPYLEACKRLRLDTKFVCREIGEPSVNKICQMINPKLKFYRNYSKIRPDCHFCEEYLKLDVA